MSSAALPHHTGPAWQEPFRDRATFAAEGLLGQADPSAPFGEQPGQAVDDLGGLSHLVEQTIEDCIGDDRAPVFADGTLDAAFAPSRCPPDTSREVINPCSREPGSTVHNGPMIFGSWRLLPPGDVRTQ